MNHGLFIDGISSAIQNDLEYMMRLLEIGVFLLTLEIDLSARHQASW